MRSGVLDLLDSSLSTPATPAFIIIILFPMDLIPQGFLPCVFAPMGNGPFPPIVVRNGGFWGLQDVFFRSIPLLQCPGETAFRMAMAVGRKKSAAVAPEQGPDKVAIRGWQGEVFQGRLGEEPKNAFGMRRGQGVEPGFYFEKEHQPVGLSFIAVFADQASQMQIGRFEAQARLFKGFTAAAGMRGFAFGRV